MASFLWVCVLSGVVAAEAAGLRLVPYPKEVQPQDGRLVLDQRLVLEAPAESAPLLARQLQEEWKRAGCEALPILSDGGAANVLTLRTKKAKATRAVALRGDATPEDYVLQVAPDAITVTGAGPAGLFRGTQTLRQLIRANRRDGALACVTIRDWPSVRWRAFQDDLTRGPSSRLENLQLQTEVGAFFKLNLFTYYMEYQYAFAKHPVIGPRDGALTPGELKQWVEFARPLHLDILGNQQSFGHFTAILAHPEYADLRETEYLLNPTTEKTYALLDDLYSEVIPLLPFPFFNVCCDETDGLGQGPAKAVAEKVGVGALYVEHVRRLHQLVHDRYGKRMMMWGDIILRHPDQLEKIPKDVVMLTWGYDPRASFEDQIVPFAKSGYEFFVCPGVNCWNRVLPDFSAATTNIQNFVRDGVKHGAIGVLNTAWDDDGENFNAPNWHGIAWGAECAWNASATPAAEFNRRLGGVLFGERTDHFGQAIAWLSTPGLGGLPNSTFWQFNFGPLKIRQAEDSIGRWRELLASAREAIAHLKACQKGATVNAELLDFFLYGAQRLELYAQRELDRLEAAIAYRSATLSAGTVRDELVVRARRAIQRSRDAHAALRGRFAELWPRENKPYAMDWTLQRYDALLGRFDGVLEKLGTAATVAAGERLPAPAAVGLELVETFSAK